MTVELEHKWCLLSVILCQKESSRFLTSGC